MLLYPKVSAAVFKLLRCRELGPSLAVLEVRRNPPHFHRPPPHHPPPIARGHTLPHPKRLTAAGRRCSEADYGVLCVAGPAGAADPQTARYQFYKTVALALVVAIPVGVPCALLALLLRARRHALRTAVAAAGGERGGEAGASRETLAASEAPTAPAAEDAAAAGGDEDEAAAALAGGGGEQGGEAEWVYQRLHATGYGFAIADFKPGCLWCVVVAPCNPLETVPAAVCLCLLLARGWRAPRLQSLGIHQQPVPVLVASPELACP